MSAFTGYDPIDAERSNSKYGTFDPTNLQRLDPRNAPAVTPQETAASRGALPAGPAGPAVSPAFASGDENKGVGEALKIIRESIPIPGTLGRICNHPCEEICNRGVIDEPIGVMRLKRFAVISLMVMCSR